MDIRKCSHGHDQTEDAVYVTPKGVKCCRVCLKRGMERFHKRNPDYNKKQKAKKRAKDKALKQIKAAQSGSL